MATVADLAGLEAPGRSPGTLDVPLCSVNRMYSGTPLLALTPRFRAERVQDSTTGVVYRAVGLTHNTWAIDNYNNSK